MEQEIDLTAAFAALNNRIDTLEGLVKQIANQPLRQHKKATKEHLQFAEMLQYIEDAKRYHKDKTYASFLKEGFMPRGKLLKLAKVNCRAFDNDVEAALAAGVIKQVSVLDKSKNKQSICYVTPKRYDAIKQADERLGEHHKSISI